MPHRKKGNQRGHSRGGAGAARARDTSEGGPTSSTEDLKQREYQDEKGQTHHHTRTSEDYRKKK